MSTATVSASYAKAFLEFAVIRGADRAALEAQAALAPDELADPDGRVTFERFKVLARTAKRVCGEPALALHFGASPLFFQRSILGLIIHAASSMAEAVAQMNRYGPLVNDFAVVGGEGRFVVAGRGSATWFEDRRADPNDCPEVTEAVFARLTAHHEHLFPGSAPFVHEVHVTHAAPMHRDAYEAVIKAPVHFGSDRNAARIEPGWLKLRPPGANSYVFGIFSAHAEALLRTLEDSKSLRGRIESLLIPRLHTGEIGMEEIAARLGMSRATLYRRLKEEDTSFESVLDDLRRRMAQHYLDGRKASVGETAYLVGFSDAAAFTRAYKRWTGNTPRAMAR